MNYASPEERRALHRKMLEELHSTKDFYDQIRDTTTLTERGAQEAVRNAMAGTCELQVDAKQKKAADIAEKISLVRDTAKGRYRTNGRKRIPSSEFTDYESDWATTYCNILGGIAVFFALILLYVMWFTNLIK